MGYIYKTTNLLSGNFYIGKKSSDEFDPTYLGSGMALRNAVKKHGKENFKVEILEEGISGAEMLNERERFHIADQDACSSYNIALGGEGGDTISNHPNKKEIYANRNQAFMQTPENKATKAANTKQRYVDMYNDPLFDCDAYSAKWSDINKKRWKANPLTEDQRKQWSATAKHNYQKDPTLNARTSVAAKKAWTKRATTYRIHKPSGEIIEIQSLRPWCEENNVPYYKLYCSIKRGTPSPDGWMVEKLGKR
jgi:hypothetical protein